MLGTTQVLIKCQCKNERPQDYHPRLLFCQWKQNVCITVNPHLKKMLKRGTRQLTKWRGRIKETSFCRSNNSEVRSRMRYEDNWAFNTRSPLHLFKVKAIYFNKVYTMRTSLFLLLKFIPKNILWSKKWFSFSCNPKMNFTEL